MLILGRTDMTPEERDLISGLFERMRAMGSIDKDREAEDFIARSVRQTPDAAYMMVQTVLVQENALQQAGDRIEDLEARVRELERGQPRAAGQGGGSFLGGIFGGGGRSQNEARGGSVPAMGSRRDRPYDEPDRAGGSPWGQRAAAGGFGQAAQAQGGGGFLRGAMTTAAGVAGGMLLANSISGMMGGESGKAQASEATTAKPEEHSPYEVNQKPEEASQASHYQDANDNDPGNYDNDSSWGDGGGDIDI
jgi:uncharacterized protein